MRRLPPAPGRAGQPVSNAVLPVDVRASGVSIAGMENALLHPSVNDGGDRHFVVAGGPLAVEATAGDKSGMKLVLPPDFFGLKLALR